MYCLKISNVNLSKYHYSQLFYTLRKQYQKISGFKKKKGKLAVQLGQIPRYKQFFEEEEKKT